MSRLAVVIVLLLLAVIVLLLQPSTTDSLLASYRKTSSKPALAPLNTAPPSAATCSPADDTAGTPTVPRKEVEEKMQPSGLHCLLSRRPTIHDRHRPARLPILRHVKVEFSSRWMRGDSPLDDMDESDRPEGPAQKRDRLVKIHLCGKDAAETARKMQDCVPFWKDYLTPPTGPEDLNQRHVFAATEIILHPDTLAPCHFHPLTAPSTRGSNRTSVQIEDDVWLNARYSMNNQYHGLVDQGLLQTWESWKDASAAAAEAREETLRLASNESDAATEEKLLLLHEYSTNGRRLPFLSVRDAGFEGAAAYHDLWQLLLPVNVRLIPQGVQLTLYAKRLMMSHFSFTNGVGYGGSFLHTDLGFIESGREFGNSLQTAMGNKFGGAWPPGKQRSSAPLLFDGRPVQTYDGGMHRARGVEPVLKEEFAAALIPEFASGVTTIRFSTAMSLREHWNALQSHQVVVAGEGAFFVWLLLAAPGSTWIMVYNHTHPPFDDIRASNYHTPVALFANWTRLIVYVVDHDRRESGAELARVMRETPWRGGDVIHVGALSDSTSKYKHTWLRDHWTRMDGGGELPSSAATVACLAEKRVAVKLISYWGRPYDAFNREQGTAEIQKGTQLFMIRVGDILKTLFGNNDVKSSTDPNEVALVVHDDQYPQITAATKILSREGNENTVTALEMSKVFAPSNMNQTNVFHQVRPVAVRMVKTYPKVLVCDLGNRGFMRAMDMPRGSWTIDIAPKPQGLEEWRVIMADGSSELKCA